MHSRFPLKKQLWYINKFLILPCICGIYVSSHKLTYYTVMRSNPIKYDILCNELGIYFVDDNIDKVIKIKVVNNTS